MSMENKSKHLEIIQGVINRMAQCSFLLKGWTVTIVAALLALTVTTQEKIGLITISLLPVIVFWILDSYYLWQERLFREVYKNVSQKDEADIDFQMNPTDFIGQRNTWFKTAFSKTILIYYGALIVTMSGVLIFLNTW